MGARPPALAATIVTGDADTVDVGGLAFRISCRNPKPGFWARDRPEFLTSRAPDVEVTLVYDDDFRRRARLPAGEDTFSDAPRVRRCGSALLLTTAYYRAAADLGLGRVTVRIAGGFGVANLMRTLAALWLLERGAVLLRAVRLGRDGATLACGIPEAALGAPRGTAIAGYFAVTPGSEGVTARLTPFLDGNGPLPARREARTTALWVPGDTVAATRPGGAAGAVAVLLSAIWQADRRRAALVRTLDLATRIVTQLPCVEISTHGETDVAVG